MKAGEELEVCKHFEVRTDIFNVKETDCEYFFGGLGIGIGLTLVKSVFVRSFRYTGTVFATQTTNNIENFVTSFAIMNAHGKNTYGG